eukprot:TRINITY_DN4420_c0_g1_i14.p2 TRINITY_DN4420_c0_g1~~TRINITY_DN4420_c0_g1_i14.p2  ORF type:complete len:103 (-),score=16.17 TRINITY_DN4420_c0_g1_i14:140-448(-)
MDSDVYGILSFSRIDAATEMVVIVNPKGDWQYVDQIVVDRSINYDSEVYFDLTDPSQKAAVSVGQTALLNVKRNMGPRSIAVYGSSSNTYQWNQDLGVTLCA